MVKHSQLLSMDQKQNKFRIVDTTATQKVFSLRKRIRAVSGGTSASKTVSILVWLIDYCQNPQNKEKLVTVTSESYPHLSGGAVNDFQMIMKDRGYWKDHRWVRSPRTVYTFETGNKIEFVPFDTYGKAHGGRRDVLFINEGNYMSYNIVDQLITRTREIVWMDWNPTSEFWFYTDMLGVRDDIDFITLTYKDNEALDETTVREIESHKHLRNWWRVYGLGLMGELEGKIYTNWKMIDEIPEEALLMKRGLDFGYSNDPTAGGELYKWNDSYVLDEVVYLKGLTNKPIADIFLALDNPKTTIIADSQEPKSIEELKLYGLNVVPARKGRDSVNNGIQFVQQQNIFVTKRSINIWKEYRNYMWQVDKDGKILNDPREIWDHHMDWIRYVFEQATVPRWEPGEVGGVQPYYEDLPG